MSYKNELQDNNLDLQTLLNAVEALPEAIKIDSTLTVSGAAADAKAVGDMLAEHNHNASDINAGTLSVDRLPLTELTVSMGAAQIATGSFNGTGQTSFSITFPFVPKFVFIHSVYNNISIQGSCVYVGGDVAGGSYYNGTNVISANVTVSGTTLTFKEVDNIRTYINATDVVVRWAAFA